MTKVYITDRIDNPNIEKNILGDALVQDISNDISILLVWHQEITGDYLSLFPGVKHIIRYGVGYDKVDLAECKKRNITVSNNPAYCIEEVSATATAMILNIARGTSEYDAASKFYYNSWQENAMTKLRRNSEITVGIIGAGNIGSWTMRNCQAIGFKTLFYDPYLTAVQVKLLRSTQVTYCGDLLQQSDIVSLHCPLNAETKKMVNKDFIAQMKKGSSLVNTARGGLIADLSDIEDALKSHHLNSVFLDVLPSEPPSDHPLIASWRKNEVGVSGRLIINPHAAYYSSESSYEQRVLVAQNALGILNGKSPENIVKY